MDKVHKSKETKAKKTTSYQCELCGYATNRATNYNMHYKMVHLKSRTQCELCGKEYSNMKRHQQRVHQGLRVTCNVCQKEVSNIDKHKRVHRNRGDKISAGSSVMVLNKSQ